MVLGGIEIPFERGLDGHSDADVLLHAIADALLGAAVLGDIGHHFPPGDETWRGVDSRVLLGEVVRLVTEAGWVPVHIDATVIAEAPKVNPLAERMRQQIAACTGIDLADISLKATTNERMGFVGREEGIAAIASATIVPRDEDGMS
jgi:2-C-methyl-D-erythritol 2,4-cyclodiphosphate synthase